MTPLMRSMEIAGDLATAEERVALLEAQLDHAQKCAMAAAELATTLVLATCGGVGDTVPTVRYKQDLLRLGLLAGAALEML